MTETDKIKLYNDDLEKVSGGIDPPMKKKKFYMVVYRLLTDLTQMKMSDLGYYDNDQAAGTAGENWCNEHGFYYDSVSLIPER